MVTHGLCKLSAWVLLCEYCLPQGAYGGGLLLCGFDGELRWLFVQAGAVLQAAQVAVGFGRGVSQLLACGQDAQVVGALEQGDVAAVLQHVGVLGAVQQYQVLRDEFGVDHAAGAVFEVEDACFFSVGLAHALAHGDDFVLQAGCIARCGEDLFADAVEQLMQARAAEAAAGAGHGLMFPDPGGVAAALQLVVFKSGHGGGEQARVAVGAQGSVDFVQVAFAGFGGEPHDEFAHQRGVDFAGALVAVFVQKDQIQVAAVAQLQPAQFAVGDDGEVVGQVVCSAALA